MSSRLISDEEVFRVKNGSWMSARSAALVNLIRARQPPPLQTQPCANMGVHAFNHLRVDNLLFPRFVTFGLLWIGREGRCKACTIALAHRAR